VWGVAYNITGFQPVQKAMQYLNNREMKLGGYWTLRTQFYPRGYSQHDIEVLVYIATPQNPDYLGPAETNQIAEEIVQTRGTAGTNSEYVTRLADFVQTHIQEDKDQHLFQLDRTVRYLDLFIVYDTERSSTQRNSVYNTLYNFHGDALATSFRA